MLLRLSALAVAASLVAALSPQDIPADVPVQSHLSSAQAHLSKGETSEALVYYDAAIARDPTNYLTFFKRATTYLSLGRTTQATQDFDHVLSLKPGFEGAHLQLAKIRSRSADWAGAKEQYQLANKGPGSEEWTKLEEAEGAVGLAHDAEKAGNWEECVSHAGAAIVVANRAVSLREVRARCRFERGEVEEGMSDLQHVLQMKPGDTSPHVKIAAITFYSLGDVDNGMARTRKCLHSDPDSKVCKKLLRQQKGVEKTLAKVTKALEKHQPMTGVKMLVESSEDVGLIKEIKEQEDALRADGFIPQRAPSTLYMRVVDMACQAYYEMNSQKMGQYCDDALKLNENSFFGLLYRSKTLLDKEEYEASIEALNKAAEARPDKQDIVNPLLQKARIALRRSQTKDYYKVLGVAQDADDRQIKSAYRKLSKQHHPDKAKNQGLSKDEAEKKMASINEAYEVLSNPELRARFDRGDDPNAQGQQQAWHGSPFGGGQPFVFQQGGSRFQFQYGGGGGGGGGGFPGGFPF